MILIIASGVSLNAYSQVNIDSLEKSILESVKGLDDDLFTGPYFDTSKLFSGKKLPLNLDEMFRQLDKRLRTAKLQGKIEEVEDGYRGLSRLDSMRGNYKGAYENFKLYSLYRDSLQKKEAETKALQYEFDKKQAIAKVEQEKKDADAKRIKNRQYFIIAGLTVLVLAVLTIALIQGKNSRQRKKTNTLLQSEKEKVEATLSALTSTQAQLIQAEKMASLGELTAGIAHEIQNPLNFVNNFSDLNRELLEELKAEANKGNIDEVKLIADDVINNEQKIIQHGRRADAIVKGMLQHSQRSTGEKTLTDINALADEYLRHCYHSLRAKDNFYHATIHTEFDSSAGEINIVPQDMGRVLLNLFNNAFYAVNERKKLQGGSYEPVVSLATKKIGDRVQISVGDTGNGIPGNIVEKIFQPFFTTKPTGQGTGLGLSLSYDIVKAHGGEIKVESNEGEGTTFKVNLPL